MWVEYLVCVDGVPNESWANRREFSCWRESDDVHYLVQPTLPLRAHGLLVALVVTNKSSLCICEAFAAFTIAGRKPHLQGHFCRPYVFAKLLVQSQMSFLYGLLNNDQARSTYNSKAQCVISTVLDIYFGWFEFPLK